MSRGVCSLTKSVVHFQWSNITLLNFLIMKSKTRQLNSMFKRPLHLTNEIVKIYLLPLECSKISSNSSSFLAHFVWSFGWEWQHFQPIFSPIETIIWLWCCWTTMYYTTLNMLLEKLQMSITGVRKDIEV